MEAANLDKLKHCLDRYDKSVPGPPFNRVDDPENAPTTIEQGTARVAMFDARGYAKNVDAEISIKDSSQGDAPRQRQSASKRVAHSRNWVSTAGGGTELGDLGQTALDPHDAEVAEGAHRRTRHVQRAAIPSVHLEDQSLRHNVSVGNKKTRRQAKA